MLSINKEILKVVKKRNLSKILIEFVNNKDMDVCILLNKNINLNDFRNYLTRLLKKNVDTSCLINSSDSKKYFYINNVEKFNGFSGERITFVLVPMNEKFLKEDYIYKIDSISDLPTIEEDTDNDFDRFFDLNRLPHFPGGHINIDDTWNRPTVRPIEPRMYPMYPGDPNEGTLRYNRYDNTLTYTTNTRMEE